MDVLTDEHRIRECFQHHDDQIIQNYIKFDQVLISALDYKSLNSLPSWTNLTSRKNLLKSMFLHLKS